MASNLDSYNKWHERSNGYAEFSQENHLDQWHHDTLSLCGPVNNLDLLEVGCGQGNFSLHLAKLGARIVGTDFSTKAIEIASDKLLSSDTSARFLVADAQALPFADKTFDLVVSCECLEHVPNPAKALTEMYRVLKPNGKLVLSTENYSNGMLIYWLMAWIQGKPFNSGAVVQPIEHFFVYWRVIRMMRRAGFSLRRMLGAHFVFFAIPGTHPHTFVRKRIKSAWLARILRPFARHMTFELVKKTDY